MAKGRCKNKKTDSKKTVVGRKVSSEERKIVSELVYVSKPILGPHRVCVCVCVCVVQDPKMNNKNEFSNQNNKFKFTQCFLSQLRKTGNRHWPRRKKGPFSLSKRFGGQHVVNSDTSLSTYRK